MPSLLSRLAARTPRTVREAAYRHRYHPVLRAVRNVLLRLEDPRQGLEIANGPLAGWRFAHDDSLAMWLGTHEPAVQLWIVDNVRPGQTAYDIGAHVGYYVLLLARQVGEEGRVVAYEPSPQSRELLDKNVSLNNVTARVTVRQAAVGAASGSASLVERHHSGELQVEHDVGGETEIVTLDEEVAAGLPSPDIIIIDIEGMETDALRGAIKILRTHSPVILAEHHNRQADLDALLADLDYTPTVLDHEHVVYRCRVDPASRDSEAEAAP